MSTTIPASARRRVPVTRAQVEAARGKLICDARMLRDTSAWVYGVAAADHDPAWQPGGAGLAGVTAWRERAERDAARHARRGRLRRLLQRGRSTA